MLSLCPLSLIIKRKQSNNYRSSHRRAASSTTEASSLVSRAALGQASRARECEEWEPFIKPVVTLQAESFFQAYATIMEILVTKPKRQLVRDGRRSADGRTEQSSQWNSEDMA